ncbi:copper chaperone CopZ [Virgibacillus kimchii]
MSKTLNVKGMSCGHCVSSVEGALKELNGVKNVQVSLENGKVTLDYDDNLINDDQITVAIEDAGYDVVA